MMKISISKEGLRYLIKSEMEYLKSKNDFDYGSERLIKEMKRMYGREGIFPSTLVDKSKEINKGIYG